MALLSSIGTVVAVDAVVFPGGAVEVASRQSTDGVGELSDVGDAGPTTESVTGGAAAKD